MVARRGADDDRRDTRRAKPHGRRRQQLPRRPHPAGAAVRQHRADRHHLSRLRPRLRRAEALRRIGARLPPRARHPAQGRGRALGGRRRSDRAASSSPRMRWPRPIPASRRSSNPRFSRRPSSSARASSTIPSIASRRGSPPAAPAIAGLVNELESTRRERDAARLALAQEVSLPDDQRGSQREDGDDGADQRRHHQGGRAGEEDREPSSRTMRNSPIRARSRSPRRSSSSTATRRSSCIEAGRERSFVLLVRKDRMLARPIGLDAGGHRRRRGGAAQGLRRARAPGRCLRPRRAPTRCTARSSARVDAGLAGVNHLIVVPTGAFASLPFGLLVTQNPKPGASRDYANAQWLLRRTAISDVPSARAFIAQREQAATTAPARPLLADRQSELLRRAGRDQGRPDGLDALDNQCRDEGPVPPQLLRALRRCRTPRTRCGASPASSTPTAARS